MPCPFQAIKPGSHCWPGVCGGMGLSWSQHHMRKQSRPQSHPCWWWLMLQRRRAEVRLLAGCKLLRQRWCGCMGHIVGLQPAKHPLRPLHCRLGLHWPGRRLFGAQISVTRVGAMPPGPDIITRLPPWAQRSLDTPKQDAQTLDRWAATVLRLLRGTNRDVRCTDGVQLQSNTRQDGTP